MGRTVVADDTIQTYVNNLLSTGQWYLGLIIGQVLNIVLLIKYTISLAVGRAETFFSRYILESTIGHKWVG